MQRACLAALGIRSLFDAAARRPGHPLAGFQAGIGIASGTAMAGKIGTTDQVKVTVFGPVVTPHPAGWEGVIRLESKS